jgi:hypothetical protein
LGLLFLMEQKLLLCVKVGKVTSYQLQEIINATILAISSVDDVISRLVKEIPRYQEEIMKNYAKLATWQSRINKLTSQDTKYLDIEVFVGAEQLSPVRLIANLLTPEQAATRLKNKSSNRKLGIDALESIGLNLFVTNVEAEKCDAEAIYELYTLRWQVELIFKTWKSVMQLHKIQAMNAVRLECVILVKLLWVMLNWSILNQLKEFTNTDISFHKLSHTLQSRSQKITLAILEHKELLYEWLLKLAKISLIHHQKEYKKGGNKMNEIIKHAYYKTA